MTEQELKDKINSLYTDYPDTAIEVTLFDHLWPTIKDYADAQVDAAVGRAMNEVGRISVEYNTRIAAKDTEIAELKASLSQAQQMYTDLLIGTTDAIAAKDAEIKRLLNLHDDKDNEITGYKVDIFQQNKEIKRLREVIRELWNRDSINLEERREFLSPAPVTEGSSIDSYPKITLEQLTETDDLTMMQRLEKRMPPFHGVAPVTDGKDENGILPCECGNSRPIFNEAVGRLGAECYIQCRGCQRTTQLFKRETLSEARHLSIQDWNSPKNDNR